MGDGWAGLCKLLNRLMILQLYLVIYCVALYIFFYILHYCILVVLYCVITINSVFYSYCVANTQHTAALSCYLLYVQFLSDTVTIILDLYFHFLYCTVLYCTALHCTALYCTALHCTVL